MELANSKSLKEIFNNIKNPGGQFCFCQFISVPLPQKDKRENLASR
jgi:hypothetical protein